MRWNYIKERMLEKASDSPYINLASKYAIRKEGE